MKVGMIGLGGMGKPIAECLVRENVDLIVFDLRQEQVDALVSQGARPAASPADVARNSHVIISSLPSNEASEKVALDEDGVLAGAKQGDIYIETSTISPDVMRKINDAAMINGIRTLDAPVSGAGAQRKDGTLTVMVGGDAATFEEARPILEIFGKNIFHVGPIGSGATVKIINNLVMAANCAASIEGLLLGIKAGLKPDIIYEVISCSSGASNIFENVFKRLQDTPTKPPTGIGASQRLHTVSKDVRLATHLAQSLNFPMIMGAAATQAWLSADAKGLRDHEMWALINVFEELCGVTMERA
tara:strand:+ start:788 stop:1693 length:906 start_codon:yes stop_codon:yes gene_type:complete